MEIKEKGDVVEFGKYYISNSKETEPLEWEVLDVKGKYALLITEKVIDCQSFSKKREDTWDVSWMRKWLNNDFCSKVFSDAEKAKIMTTPILVDDKEEPVTVYDKLFLLSANEVQKYYGDDGDANGFLGFAASYFGGGNSRTAYPTDYEMSKDVNFEDNDSYGPAAWMLRTHADKANMLGEVGGLQYVGPWGEIDSTISSEALHPCGVRPAMYVKIDGEVTEDDVIGYIRVDKNGKKVGVTFDNLTFEEKISYAEKGDEECIQSVYNTYINGSDAVKSDPQKAFYWGEKIAADGNRDGVTQLSIMYSLGYGVERDLNRAAELAEEANQYNLQQAFSSFAEIKEKADEGDTSALGENAWNMFLLLVNFKQFDYENKYDDILDYAQRAWLAGDKSERNVRLLMILFRDMNLELNINIRDLVEACVSHAGDSDDSMYIAAKELLCGEYIEKNEGVGFKLMKKLAEEDNTVAKKELGNCYDNGIGCKQNKKLALKWYKDYLEEADDIALTMYVKGMEMSMKLDEN